MFDSNSYLDDLDNQLEKIDLEKLRNKSILITGSGGLICSYVIDLLIYANVKKKANIKIYAMGRSEDKLKKRFSYYFDSPLFVPVIQDVCSPCDIDGIDYIIHGASNANPKLYVTDPIGTMNANYLGTLNMLDLAKNNNSRFLYISSGDVYGSFDNVDGYLSEDMYGYIDILNVKSSYASSKRASETLCSSYNSQYNVESLIVRPAHIYGPTCTRSDSRAVSDFINKASMGQDIIMKSDGSSVRSYCYVGDAVTGIIKVLTEGEPCNAYNISNNGNIISIRELAEIICKYSESKLIIQIPESELDKKIDSNVKTIRLDSTKLESLGWEPDKDVEDGIKLTLSVLKERKN